MEGTERRFHRRKSDFTLGRGKYLLAAFLQSRACVVCCLCPRGAENTPMGTMQWGRILKNSTNWEYKQGPGSPVACCRLESTVSIRLNVNFHTEGLVGQVLVIKHKDLSWIPGAQVLLFSDAVRCL